MQHFTIGKLPLPSIRQAYLLVFIACLSAVLIAVFYFQKTLFLQPCPLCVTQRFFMIAVGAMALIAFFHKTWHKTYALLGFVVAIAGACVSARHVWIQHLPEELVPACGPGLSYMFETMPFLEALKVLLQGDGDCADVAWSLLGISIPGWTFVTFSSFAGVYCWQFFRTSHDKQAPAASEPPPSMNEGMI